MKNWYLQIANVIQASRTQLFVNTLHPKAQQPTLFKWMFSRLYKPMQRSSLPMGAAIELSHYS